MQKTILMSTVINNQNSLIRAKRKAKIRPLTKLEMLQKMLADQKFIRESIQNGVSFKELKEKHGFRFTTI